MLLGKVTFLDITVFLVFLSWHLLVDVGFCTVALEVLRALPFLVTELPVQLIYNRYFSNPKGRGAWERDISLFQDVAIRCMRYAFANVDTKVKRVFLSKQVSLPFLRFRMWRHASGTPAHISWREVKRDDFHGVWIEFDGATKPDMVLFYIHGGGFVMGSSFFYLEFLLAVNVHLQKAGFKNPAIFALEYTLVPDATYPTQLNEALAAYQQVLSVVDRGRICLGGDSAGGTLVLSMLLHMSAYGHDHTLPAFAALFSPWIVLVSNKRNAPSDYLDSQRLTNYGRLYSAKTPVNDTIASPGSCRDMGWWKKAMPPKGMLCIYGTQELLYGEIHEFLRMLDEIGDVVRIEEETIHVWPIAAIFLGTGIDERHKSLRNVASTIHTRMCL